IARGHSGEPHHDCQLSLTDGLPTPDFSLAPGRQDAIHCVIGALCRAPAVASRRRSRLRRTMSTTTLPRSRFSRRTRVCGPVAPRVQKVSERLEVLAYGFDAAQCPAPRVSKHLASCMAPVPNEE